MRKQIVRATINGLLRHHMVARFRKRLNGVRDGSSTRRNGKCRSTTLKRRNTLFEHALRGVRQTAVNVARISQAETIGGMLRVMEHIRGGLIDRYGTGVGCGVGLLLANVELKRFELILRHDEFPFEVMPSWQLGLMCERYFTPTLFVCLGCCYYRNLISSSVFCRKQAIFTLYTPYGRNPATSDTFFRYPATLQAFVPSLPGKEKDPPKQVFSKICDRTLFSSNSVVARNGRVNVNAGAHRGRNSDGLNVLTLCRSRLHA